MIVEDLVGIVLVLGVVLAENEVKQSACGVNYGQGIELVIPDNIVCFLERGALGAVTSFSRGVMNSETHVESSMRETR